jgi:hypothetical protein
MTNDADVQRKWQRRQVRKHLLAYFAPKFAYSLNGRIFRWSVAMLLLAVVLLWVGVLKEPGSAAEWFAAGGAIFAAAVALNIATRDRRERDRERNDADLAQMRLVRLDLRWQGVLSTDTAEVLLAIDVTNWGSRPVLQMQVVRGHVASAGAGVFRMADPVPQPMPIVPTVMQPEARSGKTFLLALKTNAGIPWQPRTNDDHKPAFTPDVTVECVDADGNRWLLSTAHPDPQRQVPESNPPVLQRLWTNRKIFVREWLWLVTPPKKVRQTARAMAILMATWGLLLALSVATAASAG